MSPESGAVLQVADGCVMLGGRPILRGIDLTVDAGEVVAVLGANGSGKSTLVRAALGLLPLQRGAVSLFGTPLGRFRQWHRVGFVPQRTAAVSGVPASVAEVVSTGRLSRRRPFAPWRSADRAAVRAAIEAVDLHGRERDGVASLSGGQQQRVLIARALAGEPELLVLDEPTAGVDVAHQETLAAVVGDLARRGTAIVLVAHELGPLAPLIERTVVMRDGRLVYDGAPLPSFQDVPHEHHARPAPGPHHLHVTSPLERP